MRAQSDDLVGLRADVRAAAQRLVLALGGAASLICAALVVMVPDAAMLGPVPWATWLLGLLGVALFTIAWPSGE